MVYKRSECGSALMLVPAGILVLVILAAIAVDSSIAFASQRELISQASGAANDAATVAITQDGLQTGLLARPDEQLADRYIRSRLVGADIDGYRIKDGDVTTDIEDYTVTVHVEGDVPYVFAGAIPGAERSAHIVATASAQLRFGD